MYINIFNVTRRNETHKYPELWEERKDAVFNAKQGDTGSFEYLETIHRFDDKTEIIDLRNAI